MQPEPFKEGSYTLLNERIQNSGFPLVVDPHCSSAGEVLFGTDSHTCNAGAFGQFATGIGNTDAGFIVGTGKLLIKVPPTMRFVLDGEMPPYLLAKDLILQIIGEISVAGPPSPCLWSSQWFWSRFWYCLYDCLYEYLPDCIQAAHVTSVTLACLREAAWSKLE